MAILLVLFYVSSLLINVRYWFTFINYFFSMELFYNFRSVNILGSLPLFNPCFLSTSELTFEVLKINPLMADGVPGLYIFRVNLCFPICFKKYSLLCI